MIMEDGYFQPQSGLTSLTSLTLNNSNSITDIQSLPENTGLGAGISLISLSRT